jgi:ubiquinone/menaquinone biosynthesis C-methylase UbiE
VTTTARATPFDEPVYCFTSDVDWASEHCIADLLGFTASVGVTPTVFATHASPVLDSFAGAGLADVGIHPNFLPGSSHGDDEKAVLDHLFALFPEAETFRSHCFADNTRVVRQILERGIRYDSNLCLYLQPDLVPLRHGTGIVRLPVFWEDDCHWDLTGGEWSLADQLPSFETPGLKILNVHPFPFAANVTSEAHYLRVRSSITTLTTTDLATVAHPGDGTRTFVTALVQTLIERGARFHTLKEIYEMTIQDAIPSTDPQALGPKGRVTVHTEEEHRSYASMTDADKQALLRSEYEQRDATDPYATSRDYNARELEILAIRRALDDGATNAGRLLDLGCGNGYTLLALGASLVGWDLCGVDFSDNLVDGALRLREERSATLSSTPTFVKADAIVHLAATPDASVDHVLTERFLQNMPSPTVQRDVIREIHRILKPGGRLLMCEGSADGFDGLNQIRAAMALPEIPATSRENVSAIRFHEEEIERFAIDDVGFRLVDKVGFSTYFLIARVLHPLLVAPDSPRFDAPINYLARVLQTEAPMTPGYGSNVLWVFEKAS